MFYHKIKKQQKFIKFNIIDKIFIIKKKINKIYKKSKIKKN